MGKNFCNIGGKWCKFLKHNGTCDVTKCPVAEISKCPRIADIETKQLSELINDTNFGDVFASMVKWFPDQEKSKDGYEDVFNKLKTMKPNSMHNLSSLFIDIDIDDEKYLDVHGVRVYGTDKKYYGIEFTKWNDFISMFITKETLDRLTKEDIVAGCMYEMTFFGFTEEDVSEMENKLVKSIEELKQQNKI